MFGMLLSHLVKQGTLTVRWPDGTSTTFGKGNPKAAFRLKGRWTPFKAGLRPDLGIGEAYMDGNLVPEGCSIADVLEVLISNLGAARPPLIIRLHRHMRHVLRRISQFNPVGRARKNVTHHYD